MPIRLLQNCSGLRKLLQRNTNDLSQHTGTINLDLRTAMFTYSATTFNRLLAVTLLFTHASSTSFEYGLNAIDELTGEPTCLQFDGGTREPIFSDCTVPSSAFILDPDRKLVLSSTGDCIQVDTATNMPKVGPCEDSSRWEEVGGFLCESSTPSGCFAATDDLGLYLLENGSAALDSDGLYWLPHGGLERAGILNLEIRDFLVVQCEVILEETFRDIDVDQVNLADRPSCEELIDKEIPTDLPGADLHALKGLMELFTNLQSSRRELPVINPLTLALARKGAIALARNAPGLWRAAKSAPYKKIIRKTYDGVDEFLKKERFGGIKIGPDIALGLGTSGLLYGLDQLTNRDQEEATSKVLQIISSTNVQSNLNIEETNVYLDLHSLSNEELSIMFESSLDELALEVAGSIDVLKGTVQVYQETTMKGFQQLAEGQTALLGEINAQGVALQWLVDNEEARLKQKEAEDLKRAKQTKLEEKVKNIAQTGQALQTVAGLLGADEDVQQVIGSATSIAVTLATTPLNLVALGSTLLGFAGNIFGGGGASSDEIARQRHKQIMMALQDLLIEVRQGFEQVNERLDNIESLVGYIIANQENIYETFEAQMNSQRKTLLGMSTLLVALNEDEHSTELTRVEGRYVLNDLDFDDVEIPSASDFGDVLEGLVFYDTRLEYTFANSMFDPWDRAESSYIEAKNALLGLAFAERDSPAASDLPTSPLYVLLAPATGLNLIVENYDRTTWMRRVWLTIALIQRFPQLFNDFPQSPRFPIRDKLMQPLNALRDMDRNGRNLGVTRAYGDYEGRLSELRSSWSQEMDSIWEQRRASYKFQFHDFFKFQYDSNTHLALPDLESPFLGPDGEFLHEELTEPFVSWLSDHLDIQALFLAQKFGLEQRDRFQGGHTNIEAYFVKGRPCTPLFARSSSPGIFGSSSSYWVTDFSWSSAQSEPDLGMLQGKMTYTRCTLDDGCSVSELSPRSFPYEEWSGCASADQYVEAHAQAATEILQFQAQELVSLLDSPQLYRNPREIFDDVPAKQFEIAELILMSGLPREFFPSYQFSSNQTIASKIIRRTAVDLARNAYDRLLRELLFIANADNFEVVKSNLAYGFEAFELANSFVIDVGFTLLDESEAHAREMRAALDDHAKELDKYGLYEVPYVTAAELELDAAILCASSGAVDCRPGKARTGTVPPTMAPTKSPSAPSASMGNSTISPTKSPVTPPPPPPPPSSSVCFSSSNTVQVEGKGQKSIEELEIGDFVKTAPNKYSRVYSFGHKDHNQVADYLQIHSDENVIEVSDAHFLFVNNEVQTAEKVRIGDKLGNSTVTAVHYIQRRGLFAPLTESGEIEVSGVRASNYISLLDLYPTLQVQIYHNILAPLRVVCRLTPFCQQEQYPNGYSNRIEWLIHLAELFAIHTSSTMQLALVLVIYPLLVGLSIAENMLIWNPILVIAVVAALIICRWQSNTKIFK